MSLTVAQRNAIPLDDFAWPEERKFPVDTQAHLDSLATLIGTAPTAQQPNIKARAIAIATRKGFTLPDSWQADTTESVMTETVSKPLKKIATLTVCWLEYNAHSLNGRIYPPATCDAIYESGQRKLADTNSLPITCFVSHETANTNVNTELVGRVVKIWQEGAKFYAHIDLADTTVSRDMLALAEGGYLASESMRVVGVKLVYDDRYDLPLVVPEDGYMPELMGIDLTTKPGLTDTARILAVLYESVNTESHQPFIEAFALNDVSIEARKGAPMSIPIFLKVIAGALEEAMTEDRKAHQRIHDHLAGVLDATVADKHGAESARLKALVEAELSEEGRAIAQKHAVKIAAAHDESAKACGMDCEGAYNDALGIALDPDQDGGNTDPSDQKNQDDEEEESMTPQEMMEALKKAGYTVNAPKSREEQLEETLNAKLAEQERKFNEQFAALKGTAEPQRKTQVLGGVEEGGLVPEPMYETGDYLSGKLSPKNWKALANPRVPWPQDLDPELVLSELAPFMTYDILSAQEAARGHNLADAIRTGIIS